ncbi:MAG: ribonuclease G [Candidatus Kapaibacterium sp.]|nr:MAG: ribonuclease G [Candidatus Kapabacteria bacterium]
MKQDIYISHTLDETRIAITERGELVEYFADIPDRERLVGSIFLGKVEKIVQGMNAAFIDIGLDQDAFLHFSDVDTSLEEHYLTDDDNDSDGIVVSTPVEELTPAAREALRLAQPKRRTRSKPTFQTKRSGQVIINLQPRQLVLVQVIREAYASKGVRVTTRITLPGRYVVFLPFENVIGISRKITSVAERRRLRAIARQVLPPGAGCIIRTAAENQSERELQRDWDLLLTQWRQIERQLATRQKPGLLYREENIASSIIRDLLTPSVERVVVDSTRIHRIIETYLAETEPELLPRLHLYRGAEPLFEHAGIAEQLPLITARTIPLPSGGSIVLDHTEAMLVVDVNTGRATTDAEQENNAYRTNLEAAEAVARQLRLRDVGGIIIVDFIDMKDPKHRQQLLAHMRHLLRRDRAKTVLYSITELGLLQMTRQRVRQNLFEWLTEPCPTCDGVGRISNRSSVVSRLDQWLAHYKKISTERRLTIRVHPTITAYLSEGSISRLVRLMVRHFIRLRIEPDPALPQHSFRIISSRSGKDVTATVPIP